MIANEQEEKTQGSNTRSNTAHEPFEYGACGLGALGF